MSYGFTNGFANIITSFVNSSDSYNRSSDYEYRRKSTSINSIHFVTVQNSEAIVLNNHSICHFVSISFFLYLS